VATDLSTTSQAELPYWIQN